MNTQLHRVIFNKARCQCMAVAETAKAHGKDSQVAGSRGGAATAFRLRQIASAAIALVMALESTVHPALAQIVADQSAAGKQRPTVLVAPNGVAVVNIQTPSAAGVSRNTYSQFDVQAQGAILNNSRGNAQTQLGGWVQGNPWLARGEARVILNEVNSANPSQLRGYVEVAGRRSELIIANPSGIQVNGGGFINANQVTLTTGAPQFGANGSFDGYRIERGTITIDGQGMDASLVDHTGLLARAVQVNAGIWAKDLGVIAGANTVSAAAGQNGKAGVQGAAGSSEGKPQFAIDVSQLGGMYAGHITLVGTEAGVGVRNAGTIGASAGQVQLDANGMLTNNGVLGASAPGQNVVINTHGQGLANSGTIASQGNVQIVDSGAARNSGTINARRELQLGATGLDNSQGQLAAGRLDIQAGSLTNMGHDSGHAASTTQAAISGIAGKQDARTGDAESGIKRIFDQDKVQKEIDAQAAITREFNAQASKAISNYVDNQRKELAKQLKKAGTTEEKAQVEQAIKNVNMQERALNILAGALTGMVGSVVTKEGLSMVAEQMRNLMLEDSRKFAGVVDSTGKELSNISGPSAGVHGDGEKLGGTRVDLDMLCGAANERCKTNADKSLALDMQGRVQFDNDAAEMTMEEFIKTPEGQKMLGATGGVQGMKRL
jgi:filamentous hemagglutinin family protein